MHNRIDHIVVRVRDLDASMKDYQDKLRLSVREGPEELPELGMRRAILSVGGDGNFIELAEPLGDDSAIGKSLDKQGEGLHLVALAVEDVAAAAEEMKESGASLIETGGMTFVHPRDGHGVLYQLVERK